MARTITGNLYKIIDQKGMSTFVDCANLEDLFHFVARKVIEGHLITGVTAMHPDNTTPRVKVLSDPRFKKILEEERRRPAVISDSRVIKVPATRGSFEIVTSTDPSYPGVDVEYVPDDLSEEIQTLPRVCMEEDSEDGTVDVHVWANGNIEDETHHITFAQTKKRN